MLSALSALASRMSKSANVTRMRDGIITMCSDLHATLCLSKDHRSCLVNLWNPVHSMCLSAIFLPMSWCSHCSTTAFKMTQKPLNSLPFQLAHIMHSCCRARRSTQFHNSHTKIKSH